MKTGIPRYNIFRYPPGTGYVEFNHNSKELFVRYFENFGLSGGSGPRTTGTIVALHRHGSGGAGPRTTGTIVALHRHGS